MSYYSKVEPNSEFKAGIQIKIETITKNKKLNIAS